ncbi:MAG: zf-HC2 domain-containing protein [Candidatus Eisenbacteria bacterium]|uniref:Zf-HC2 domain-containing protein n=1 Tax=Eiseniibacteriota bacterium TaxID=2212470 RepID=A0A933SFL5_UNCEI|nr:zf-HC2 domain-containing protein [Candidatus Eisenbacteria bacterium]
MSHCTRARDLFGAFWDDEITRAERDWLEGHFRDCAACRSEYETYSRALGLVQELPRVEAAPDLAARALAEAKRRAPEPDRIFVRETPRWAPVAAAAAVLLAVLALLPYVTRMPGSPLLAQRDAGVSAPRLVAAVPNAVPAPVTPETAATAPATGTAVAENLFDHSEDIDFVLDPVQVRRGRAVAVSNLPEGVQGEQAVITF